MNRDQQLKLQAWVDGELAEPDAAEVAGLTARDPAAQALVDELRVLQAWCQLEEVDRHLPESRAFYWSKIERGIAALSSSDTVAAAPRPGVADWVRWLVPAGLAALLMLGLVLPGLHEVPKTTALQSRVEIENPQNDLSSFSFRSDSDQITVFWIGSD